MPYGSLTGDLYSMMNGNKTGYAEANNPASFLKNSLPRSGKEDKPEEQEQEKDKDKPAGLAGTISPSADSTAVKPESEDKQQQRAVPQSEIETAIANVSNQYAIWFGDRYAFTPKESETFRTLVEGSSDPVDTAGRYIAATAIAKRIDGNVAEVFANLDSLAKYFTGDIYRPDDSTFWEKVNASFASIALMDKMGEWGRIVNRKGFDDPAALALEQEIIAKNEEIGGIFNGIPKGFLSGVLNDSIASLGYTLEGIKYGAGASVGFMAAAAPGVGTVMAANPIAGAAVAATAALWAGFASATASFQRTGDLSMNQTFWDLTHLTDAEGNLLPRDIAKANLYAGINKNITGFLETMGDGIISRGTAAFSPVLTKRLGIPNLSMKILTDRGVSGAVSRFVYSGADWVTGALNEGFIQEGPEEVTTQVLTALYKNGVGSPSDTSLKQLASDYLTSSLRGSLVGLVYGGVGVPQTMRNYNQLSLELRRMANTTDSEEVYREKAEKMRPEDVSRKNYDPAVEVIWNASKNQRDEYFENIRGKVTAYEDLAVEELYDSTNVETGEETQPLPDGTIYRNPDDESLYTETRDENGRKRVYVGDRRNGAIYGYAELTTDGETLTVGSVRIREGYENIRAELVQKAISEQRTTETRIEWNPDSEGLRKVKEILVQNNPRGREAGLDYGFAEAYDHDIQQLADSIGKAIPSLTKPQSILAARIYSIADRTGNLSKLNGGQPVRNSDSLPARYRGAADAAKAIIYAGKNADFSTFYHEIFHVNAAQRPAEARQLSNAIRSSMQDEASKANLRKFLEESGPIFGEGSNADSVMENLASIAADSDASQWSREQFENLARLAEAYATADNSRRSSLPEAIRNILKKIADFMRQVYQTVKHTVPLPKEITDAYDAIMYKTAKTEAITNSDVHYQKETKKLSEKYSSRIKNPENWKGRPVREFFREYRADITEAIKEYPKVRMDGVLLLEGMTENDMPFQKELLQSIIASNILGSNIILLPRFGTNFLNDMFGVELRKGSLADGLAALTDGDRYIEFKAVNEENLVRRLNEASKDADIGFVVVDNLTRRGRRKLVSPHSQFRLPDGFVSYIVGLSDNAVYVLSNKNKELSLELLADRPERVSTLEELSSTLKEYIHGPQSSRTFEPISYDAYMKAEPSELLFQSAYHGSPHSFDRFSTDHIGEGAGSQSFGWGIYITSDRKIAEGYAELGISEEDKASDIEYFKKTLEAARKRSEEAKERFEANPQDQTLKREYDTALRQLNDEEEDMRNLLSSPAEGRNLYTVDIPDTGYIKWDSEVPESLARRIAVALEADEYDTDDIMQYYRTTGAEMYSYLSKQLDGDKNASLFLRGLGVVGIDYPAGTRMGLPDGANAGARNYVIFSGDDIALLDHLVYQDAKTPDTSDFSEEEKAKRQKIEEADKAYLYNQPVNMNEYNIVYASNAKEAEAHLRTLQGKEVVNKNDGSTARISSNTIGKILSNKALNKSLANGFTREEHDTAAANIDTLFREAVRTDSRPDRRNSPDIKAIHTYETAVQFPETGREGISEILVKESMQNGRLIYTLELAELKTRDPSASRLGDSVDEPTRSQGLSIIKLSSSDSDVNYQNSIDDFYDGFESEMDSIETPEDAEKAARVYSEWDIEVDEEATNINAAMIDEDEVPEWFGDTVNLMPDGTMAENEAEYEKAVHEELIPKLEEDAGLTHEKSGESQVPESEEDNVQDYPGVRYFDSFDEELSWKNFVDRNKPEADYSKAETDAEKDDIFLRTIQDDDSLIRYLGIIGEALYLNTSKLNADWHFIDQIARERVKKRVFDTITNTSIRNASLKAIGPGSQRQFSKRMLNSVRKEMSESSRFYRNIFSYMLQDAAMKPEELIKEVGGLKIPTRDVLDEMPVEEFRALATDAKDMEIIDKIEKGTLLIHGDEDDIKLKEVNEAIDSLADRIKNQQEALKENEVTIKSLQNIIDDLNESLKSRDQAIGQLIQDMKKVESIARADMRKLSDDTVAEYSFTDSMKKIAAELRELNITTYEKYEAEHLKGKKGKYEIPRAKRDARAEYINNIAAFYPEVFEKDGKKFGKIDDHIRDSISEGGFAEVRKVIEQRMEELRAQWKEEASAYVQNLSHSVLGASTKLSADIDSALSEITRLEKEIERQKNLREKVKENRKGQLKRERDRAHFQVEWTKAREIRKGIEALKDYQAASKLREDRIRTLYKRKLNDAKMLEEARLEAAKDKAEFQVAWTKARESRKASEKLSDMRAYYESRIAEMKAEKRAKEKDARLYRKMRTEKEKLGRAICRPVNLNNTHYSVAAPIMAIQAIVEPIFRNEYTWDLGKNPEGVPGAGTMTIDEAMAYFHGLSEAERAELSSKLSPDLVARLTGTKNPLNDFTLVELRRLAGEVSDLRRRGREMLSAKKAFERETRERIQQAIIKSVRKVYVKDDDDKKDSLPGSVERIKQGQSFKAKMRGARYLSMRMQELAQLIDGGLGYHGAAYHLLVDEKRYHQSREWRAIDARMQKIAPFLTKNAVKQLFQKVTLDLAGGYRVTYNVDDLAYIYLSQFDEDSKAAVAYGNFLDETEKGTVKNTGHLNDKGEFIPDMMSPGSIADNDALKALGDERYAVVVKVAEREIRERGLMPLVEAIKEDFESDENFRRLNFASLEAYNTPLKRVLHYLPIIRTDLKGENFRHDMADQILNLNTGDYTAAIDKGMTISRAQISPRNQRPVNLSLLGVWNKSVRNQEHLIEFAQYAKKLRGVFGTNATELIAAVNKAYSPALMKEINEYINAVIDPYYGAKKEPWENTVKNLRGRLGSAYLGWKIPSILVQFSTSAWPFLPDVGVKSLLLGYLQLGFNIRKSLAFIYEKSPMMKHRTMNTVLQEAMERRQSSYGRSTAGRAMDKFNSVGMLGLEWVDRILVAGGWLGAYNKALKQNLDAGMDTALADAAAAKTADDIVLRVQPAGDSTELPSLYRTKNELARAFLQFQSSMSVIFNNLTGDLIGFWRTKQYGKFVGTIVSYGMAGVMLCLIADGFDDDDDAADKARKLGYWFLTQGVESFPVFGSDILLALQRLITGEADYYGSGTDLFPGVSNIISGGIDLVTPEKFTEGVENIAYAIGLYTGAPVSGLKNLKRVAEEGPAALLGR